MESSLEDGDLAAILRMVNGERGLVRHLSECARHFWRGLLVFVFGREKR